MQRSTHTWLVLFLAPRPRLLYFVLNSGYSPIVPWVETKDHSNSITAFQCHSYDMLLIDLVKSRINTQFDEFSFAVPDFS